jgi:hypothetical protein
MARALALTAAPAEFVPLEALRTLIVCGCALALILAGNAAPL